MKTPQPSNDFQLTPDGTLTPEAARQAAAVVGLLALPGVTSLSLEAARALSTHAGSLVLPDLRTLEPPVARGLGWHRDWLLLDTLESLECPAANGLARHHGGIALRGLASLTEPVAQRLAATTGDLLLDGLRSLSLDAAHALAGLARTLSLDGLDTPSLDVLTALAQHAGGLSLNGLTTLDVAQATALAEHRGRLWLDGITAISVEVATMLGRHEGGLSLTGLQSLDSAAAEALTSSDLERIRATGRAVLPASLDAPCSRDEPAETRPHILSMVAPTDEPLGVAIIGGGFAGIAMAIGLLKAGRHDFAILEKAPSFGGTWRDNTYPGCACDVPSRLYSYSFAADAAWSRTYAPQPEILDYIEGVAHQHDVHRFTRFNTAIDQLAWDDDAQHWRLIASDGRRFTAAVVVSAVGGIHIPSVPEIPGLDRFAGAVFHTARWRHDIDLTGQRVAVVGTGASAIQVVPELAGVVERLVVFQRTAPWVLPRGDQPTSPVARWLDNSIPGLRSLRRQWLYWKAEARAIPFAHNPRLVGHPQRMAKAHIDRCIADPQLRRKLVPEHALGCKRVLKSDDYYSTLAREDVELVVEPIERIGDWKIVTADSIERPIDTIILATGFKPFDLTDAVHVRGRGGRSLADAWVDGPEAYRGVTVSGFPNLFLLMGPNTALGHNSILVMIEAQVAYIVECLGWLERGDLPTVEVTAAAQATYNASLDDRFERSVWRSGSLVGTGGAAIAPCASWYVHASGRNHVIWPGTSASYVAALRRAEIGDFERPAVPLRRRAAA
jgi:cation diffusion facilitator CzcD-associated flavoprotein CzcO